MGADTMKGIAAGKLEHHYSIPEMLGTAATISDTWLQLMAKRHPEVGFVGTFPGVVATNLMDHGTFPKWLLPFLDRGMKEVGLDPVACGRLHATIISSSNAVRRPATYFSVDQAGSQHAKPSSVILEGRYANTLVYDAEFG